MARITDHRGTLDPSLPAGLTWINVRVPVPARHRRRTREDQIHDMLRWLRDPGLAGFCHWHTVEGDEEAVHVKLTSADTAFAVKMRWG